MLSLVEGPSGQREICTNIFVHILVNTVTIIITLAGPSGQRQGFVQINLYNVHVLVNTVNIVIMLGGQSHSYKKNSRDKD